jgi:hypothetical protein
MLLWNAPRVARPALPRTALSSAWTSASTVATVTLAVVVAATAAGSLGLLAAGLVRPASLSVSPRAAASGSIVTLRGTSLPVRTDLVVAWDGTADPADPAARVRTNGGGSFGASVVVPALRPGAHVVSVVTAAVEGTGRAPLVVGSALATTTLAVTESVVSGADVGDASPTFDPTAEPSASGVGGPAAGASPEAPTAAPDPSSPVATSPDPTDASGDPPTAEPTATPRPTPEPSLTPGPTPRPTPDPTPRPTPAPTPKPTPDPTPKPTPDPTPTPPPAYTFDQEFSGTTLSSVWQRHFHCCGPVAGYDPSLTSVSGGYLRMSVENRSSGWFTDLIDTKTTWTQKYGFFEARMKIPKGTGLWPAFWLYYNGNGTEAEIDTMEVCANAIGTHGNNDASQLHTTIHWENGGSVGHATNTVDLSQAFHVYAVDWRASHVKFYLDGDLVWTMTDTAHIPQVALPVILNLGVGGTW